MPDTEGLIGYEPYTDQEVHEATVRYRDRKLGEVLTLLFGAAIEHHGEEIRKALGYVFDLQALEQHTNRAMAESQAARQAAMDAQAVQRKMHLEINRLENRLGSLNKRLTEAETRLLKEGE